MDEARRGSNISDRAGKRNAQRTNRDLGRRLVNSTEGKTGYEERSE